MDPEEFFVAMSIRAEKNVPRWYGLSPLHNPPGLKLTMDQKLWESILLSCGKCVNPQDFQIVTKENDRTEILFPFPVGTTGNRKSLQKTIALVFEAMDCTIKKYPHPNELQLIACGILRSVEQMKGYLIDAYVSYEMKQLLDKSHADDTAEYATKAMRKAARYLRFPVASRYFIASVYKGGFLCFGVGDGSGACFCTNYQDKENPKSSLGYTMTSDNIDSPDLQLIFLYALATVMEWGYER